MPALILPITPERRLVLISLLFPIYKTGMREAKDFSQVSWTVGREAKTCSPVSPVPKPLSSAGYMADASLILRVLGEVVALGREGVKWGKGGGKGADQRAWVSLSSP